MGKDEKPLAESIRENLAGFSKFLYNKEEKTVLGRNSASWGRITVFYIFYYAFLAALFAISITITFNLMPTDEPYFKTRLQTPGVTIQPKIPSKVEQSSDIIYTTKDGVDSSYKKYTNQLKEFLKDYNASDFGQCGTDYEAQYKAGKPCVFVKINKIINWTPLPFFDINEENKGKYKDSRESESKAPSLQKFINTTGIGYNPNRYIYVSCYGVETTKTDSNDVKDIGVVELTPDGLPREKYPYVGKKEMDSYICPIVAVQFLNITKNVDLKVGCKAYARNIYDEARINAGYMHFNMKICADTNECSKG